MCPIAVLDRLFDGEAIEIASVSAQPLFLDLAGELCQRGAVDKAILPLARLARVVRLLLATAGLRRFAARLGKVAIVAGVVVVLASLAAYQAEHKTNPEFATVGDAFWWGIVTLSTVGYGDIVPKTTGGGWGVAIMFTGIAVLGVLGGSLAALFNLQPVSEEEEHCLVRDGADRRLVGELAALQFQLREVERRLGRLAQLIAAESGKSD